MQVRDSPPARGAPEHDRPARKPLLVAKVKRRNRGIRADLVDSEIFWNEPLEGWALRRRSANKTEHPLELRLDGGAFEPLRRFRRREEPRRLIVEGCSEDVPVEVFEGRQESGERRPHRRIRDFLRRRISRPRVQSDDTDHTDDQEAHRAFHGVDISRGEVVERLGIGGSDGILPDDRRDNFDETNVVRRCWDMGDRQPRR
jgi:hypothetical protein